jgi:hypothetical protein
MPKHTTESILPGGGLPTRTPYQFSRYIETGSTGEPELCLRTEQVYHKSAFFARERGINGYQPKADAVISAVPPFLRAPKGGGFLGVFL